MIITGCQHDLRVGGMWVGGCAGGAYESGTGVRRVVGGFAVVALLAWAAGSAQAASPKWSLALPQNSSASQKNAMGWCELCRADVLFRRRRLLCGDESDGHAHQDAAMERQCVEHHRLAERDRPDGRQQRLNGVSCVSSTFCVAVGYYTQSGSGHGRSSGRSSRRRTWPEFDDLRDQLRERELCVAAGDTIDASFVNQTLIERWNGRAWSVSRRRTAARRATSCGVSAARPGRSAWPTATTTRAAASSP